MVLEGFEEDEVGELSTFRRCSVIVVAAASGQAVIDECCGERMSVFGETVSISIWRM